MATCEIEELAARFAALGKAITPALQQIGDAWRAATPQLRALAEAVDPDFDSRPARADGRPHPPRPSSTPPMWSVNPTQTRRRRHASS